MEALYLDLEDLKQSQSDGGGGGGERHRQGERETIYIYVERERDRHMERDTEREGDIYIETDRHREREREGKREREGGGEREREGGRESPTNFSFMPTGCISPTPNPPQLNPIFGPNAEQRWWWWLLLYSAILHPPADSLHSHVILHEWLAYFIARFLISTEVVCLQHRHGWCHTNLLQRGYQKSDPGGYHYYVGCSSVTTST